LASTPGSLERRKERPGKKREKSKAVWVSFVWEKKKTQQKLKGGTFTTNTLLGSLGEAQAQDHFLSQTELQRFGQLIQELVPELESREDLKQDRGEIGLVNKMKKLLLKKLQPLLVLLVLHVVFEVDLLQ